MEITGFMPPDEFWATQQQLEERIRAAAASLPLFQLAAWDGPVALGTWQMDASEGSVLHLAGFTPERPRIEVTTTTRDAEEVCRNRFMAANGPPLSREDLQRLEGAFDQLPRHAASIAIDSTDADFTVRLGNGTWWATGSHGGFGVAIEGTEPVIPAEAIALVAVRDIEPLLESHRAMLRRMRGEG